MSGDTSPAQAAVISPSPAATSAQAPAPAQPSAGAAGFSCTPLHGGGGGVLAQLVDVRVGHHAGFDRITFQVAPAAADPHVSAVPEFQLTQQASTVFDRDPSGRVVTLQGSSGLRLVLHGTSGVDTSASPAQRTYAGPTDMRPALPAIRELAELGDFERVLTWGAGVAAPACIRVEQLTSPARLAVDIATG